MSLVENNSPKSPTASCGLALTRPPASPVRKLRRVRVDIQHGYVDINQDEPISPGCMHSTGATYGR